MHAADGHACCVFYRAAAQCATSQQKRSTSKQAHTREEPLTILQQPLSKLTSPVNTAQSFSTCTCEDVRGMHAHAHGQQRCASHECEHAGPPLYPRAFARAHACMHASIRTCACFRARAHVPHNSTCVVCGMCVACVWLCVRNVPPRAHECWVRTHTEWGVGSVWSRLRST